MSFTRKDRNIRAERGSARAGGEPADTLAAEIARALALEFGDSVSKVKVVARLTRSNERTVKNWFGGRNGPSGEGLVALMRHSDEVLGAVLRLARREDALVALDVARVSATLRDAADAVDRLLDGD